MRALRRRKLSLLCVMMAVIGLVIALVLYALRQNISLFYTPTELSLQKAPLHQLIRAGGMVVPGSVIRSGKDLSVQFQITDYQHTVWVFYKGILPDLFREGQGIVTRGQLTDATHFQAVEVLAKHDEKYMPPEVKGALSHAKVSV